MTRVPRISEAGRHDVAIQILIASSRRWEPTLSPERGVGRHIVIDFNAYLGSLSADAAAFREFFSSWGHAE